MPIFHLVFCARCILWCHLFFFLSETRNSFSLSLKIIHNYLAARSKAQVLLLCQTCATVLDMLITDPPLSIRILGPATTWMHRTRKRQKDHHEVAASSDEENKEAARSSFLQPW